MSKATITIDVDETGRLRAVILFDPPLPERPEDESGEAAWLESLPLPQLAGFIVMDEVVELFGDDVEMASVVVGDEGNDTRH